MQVKQRTISNEEAQKILVTVRSTQTPERSNNMAAEGSKVGLTLMKTLIEQDPMKNVEPLFPDVAKALSELEKAWLLTYTPGMTWINYKVPLFMLHWYRKQTSNEKKEAIALYVLSHYSQTALADTTGTVNDFRTFLTSIGWDSSELLLIAKPEDAITGADTHFMKMMKQAYEA